MTSHKEVAEAFSRKRERLTGSSMYLEDGVVYSWGSHWPIACWIGGDALLFNISGWKRSVSTRTHTALVASAIGSLGSMGGRPLVVVDVTIDEMKRHLERQKLFIEREFAPKSSGEAIQVLDAMLKKDASPHRVGWFIRKLKDDVRRFRFVEAL